VIGWQREGGWLTVTMMRYTTPKTTEAKIEARRRAGSRTR
jgi:hypothetical protein